MNKSLKPHAQPGPDRGAPFATPRRAKLVAALASVLLSLLLVSAVLVGITGEANGPLLAALALPAATA